MFNKDNFRDLHMINRNIAPGKIFRSSSFYDFSKSNINFIVDLRISVDRNKDDVNSDYVRLPLYSEEFGDYVGDILNDCFLMKPKKYRPIVENACRETYAECLLSDFAINSLRKFFKGMLEADSVAYFCKWGKDRTGILTALILRIMRTDWQAIYDDYMASQRYLRKRLRKVRNQVLFGTKSIRKARAFCYMHRVNLDYLKYAFSEVEKKHGSVERYLEEVIGLDLEAIRSKYAS